MAIVLVSVAVTGAGLIVARATLPVTACVVSEAQIATLVLEQMSYADVAAKLGCDGALRARTDYGSELVIEDYSWRGDAWPYARFDGHFINRQLHGTDKRWLSLNVAR
ncbi:MAG: hypothetical protein ABL897_13175 [Hyphomicrobium sp.]